MKTDSCFKISEYDPYIELLSYLDYSNTNVIVPSMINDKPVARIGHDCFFVTIQHPTPKT